MISSAKSQIVRQKKIEMCGMPIETDKDSISKSTEFQNSNQNSLEADSEYCSSLEKERMFLDSSSDTLKLKTLHSDESKSPLSASINNNNYNPKIHSTKTGSKLQISNVLLDKLRRSISPNPPRKLAMSLNNSMSSENHKVGKFTNLSNRLSNQAGSFFSRSCQGEELTNEFDEKIEPKSDLHTTKIKNFLNFSRSGGTKSSKRFNTSGSASHSISIEEHDSQTSSYSSPVFSKQSSLNSYDIDFEKLVKELVLPSLDEPLTSFKNKNQETNAKGKPVLQTCKTIDTSVENKIKQTIIRANTENK